MTTFMIACWKGDTCVRLLLRDLRVNVNTPRSDGWTPLRFVAFKGHLEFIRWWIASGREMDLGTPGEWETDAIGAAKRENRTEVVPLLERFKSDASKTRSEVRMELGITGKSIHLFHPLFFFFGICLLVEVSHCCSLE